MPPLSRKNRRRSDRPSTFRSLKGKLLLLVALPMTAALAGGIYATYRLAKTVYERRLVEGLQQQLDSYSNDFSGFLQRRQQVAIDLAASPEVKRLLASAKRPLEDRSGDALFRETLASWRALRDSDEEKGIVQVFAGVEKTDESYYDDYRKRKGTGAGPTAAQKAAGYDYTTDYKVNDQYWYKHVKKAGRPTFSASYVDTSSHKQTLSALAPVRDAKGSWLGAVGVDIETSYIDRRLNQMALPGVNDFFAFVVGPRGEYISSPDPRRVYLGQFSDPSVPHYVQQEGGGFDIGRRMQAQERGVASVPMTFNGVVGGRSVSMRDEPAYVLFTPVRGVGWSLGLVVAKKEALAPAVGILRLSIAIACLALGVLVAFILGLERLLVAPIRRLSEAMHLAEAGDFDAARVDPSGDDEIARMGGVFNHMLDGLKERDESLKRTVDAFRLFVPANFTDRIAKEGLAGLHAGMIDHAVVTVLFSDIRDFSTISEQSTPKEVFELLNQYMERMSRPIAAHGGFVDKFVGDAIMAIFDDFDSRPAVSAAVEMLRSLEQFNAERKKQGLGALRTGIGLNTGNVAMGTVGSQDRINTTVIGDAVNVASRLEGLTKYYRAPILIAQPTYNALSGKKDFDIREIDMVAVKGKEQLVSIYEVFSADPPELREDKHASRKKVREAIAHMRASEFEDAQRLFAELHAAFPRDPLPAVYLERIGAELIRRSRGDVA